MRRRAGRTAPPAAGPTQKGANEDDFDKKEQGLLKDLQNEEKLCVEKYRKAAENACDAKLQHIFEKIEKAEQSHYDTVTGMLAGTLPAQQGQQSKGQASRQKAEKDLKSTASRTEKQRDAYLLSDLLGTENMSPACTTPPCLSSATPRRAKCWPPSSSRNRNTANSFRTICRPTTCIAETPSFHPERPPAGGLSFCASFSSGSCGRCRTAPVSYCPRCPACPQ